MKSYGIHWFRRDLRIVGNEALAENWKRNQGRVAGFFCFDPIFLARSDFSADRFQFFIETLSALKQELHVRGSCLFVLDQGPDQAIPKVLSYLKTRIGNPTLLSWNRDYEPFARERDARVATMLESMGIPKLDFRDHLLIEPTEIGKVDQSMKPYQVFTPFSRQWLQLLRSRNVQSRVESQVRSLKKWEKEVNSTEQSIPFRKEFSLSDVPGWADVLDVYRVRNLKRVAVPIPPAGFVHAVNAVKTFKGKIAKYDKTRDFPSEDGTSRLSIYLKNGSITTTQIIGMLGLSGSTDSSIGSRKFLMELIWREFYYSILFHFPHVERGCFRKEFDALSWENNQEWFDRWKDGMTGFPIVDAGMRQLKQTGWMHNRVRMIVASFLTKDLLIDWRWGERYFMNALLDGDLAPNNGGWQWSASTGCDAQPYFRIFSPVLQSERFDRTGEYIRTFVPELKGLSIKELHRPSEKSRQGYPSAIVDHSIQRSLALELYGSVKKPKV